MIQDLLLTLLLVLLNGFFVAAEFAMVKVRASQLEMRARSGNFIARLAQTITTNLNAYLSATQLGITLSSLALGWFGERITAGVIYFMGYTLQLDMPEKVIHSIALPVTFAFITFMHIVFGELVPKAFAIGRSESVVLSLALPLRAFYLVLKPFIWVLNSIANFILRSLGMEPSLEQELHTPEEIRYLLEESKEGGAIEQDEHDLIENVFEFKETEVRSIMVPRGQIAALDLAMPSRDIVDKVIDEGYSRLPVYTGTIDNIVGLVFSKDLLSLLSYSEIVILQDVMRPAVFVQEHDKISHVLHRMKKERFHLAVVVDEFGGTAGIVSLEDVIEELVGEIQDEHDDEMMPVQMVQNEFIVQASTSIADLNDHLPLPLPESEEYQTLGGYLNRVAGRIPTSQESFELQGYTATILSSTKRAVEQVRLVQHSAEHPGPTST